MKTKETDLLDLLIVIARHKKFLFWFMLIVSVSVVAYTLLVDEEWTSTAVIRPVDVPESMNLGSSLFNLGASLLGGGIGFSGDDMITILKSRTLSEEMIDRFNLIDYYEIEETDSLKALDIALKTFYESMMEIYLDEDFGVIVIRITTTDPDLSARIANAYWKRLDVYNREQKVTKSRQNREFLERRLAEVRARIDSLAVAMRDFMQENKTLAIDEVTTEVIRLYATLVEEFKRNQIEIDYASRFMDKSSHELQKLLERRKILQQKIREFETGSGASGADYLPGLADLPSLHYQYALLKADIEVHQSLFEFLYPQFEQARLEELRDMPTLEVVDPARPTGLRSFPKRARLCVIWFVIGLIFALFIIFIMDYFQQRSEKSRELRKHLFRSKDE